ncbi:MAG: phosphoglucosamine mutase, partial [Gammaproteobacteria bacterium]
AVLKSGMTKFPQTLLNVPVTSRQDVLKLAPVKQAVLDAERRLGARGRVLLRPSGTEPVIRVMVEGQDRALVDEVVHALAAAVEGAVGERRVRSCAA